MSERESNKESRKAGNLITQEWTPEWLANFGSAENWLEQVCAAHKTALAAAKGITHEAWCQMQDALDNANAALTAERQRREQAEQQILNREARWEEIENLYAIGLGQQAQLREQLLSTQAAIEKIDKVINSKEAVLNGKIGGNLVTRVRLAIKQATNPALLHQYAAEVRKPLVDALARITEWSVATQNERYKLEMKWFGNPVCDAPNRIAADALAKVKEGK